MEGLSVFLCYENQAVRNQVTILFADAFVVDNEFVVDD